jgi:pentapeptide MXKDX repeat protein
MRRIILATALTLICGSAFAQGSTGPANQGDNMNKPGMANPITTSGSMKNTTGSNMSKDGISKDGMKNGMNKDTGGESKDGQGMNKGGAMSK